MSSFPPGDSDLPAYTDDERFPALETVAFEGELPAIPPPAKVPLALWQDAAVVGPFEREAKPTNPKDAIGVRKLPWSVVPWGVIGEIALGLLEGALKYERHNYRVFGVRASVYYDATERHLKAWWEGEDIDPASKLSHITKAMSSLAVLRDAMLNDMWEDDRPPPMPTGWIDRLNAEAARLLDGCEKPKQAWTARRLAAAIADGVVSKFKRVVW